MSGLFRLNSIEVQYSKIGGRGVFAKKPIKKGTKTTMMTPEEDSLVEKK